MKIISLVTLFNRTALIFLLMTSIYTLAEDTKQQKLKGSEKQLEIMDKDKDGKISSDEFYGPDHFFSKLDADSSGYLSLNELDAWEKKRTKRRGQGKSRRDPQKILDRMDTNKDDKISKDEFRGPSERFAKIDTNNDGYLSLDELDNMSQLRKKKHAGSQGGRGFGERGF